MIIEIIACDKDGSDGFTRKFVFENKEQFLEQWREFEKDVPFSRWYPDIIGPNSVIVYDWIDLAVPR